MCSRKHLEVMLRCKRIQKSSNLHELFKHYMYQYEHRVTLTLCPMAGKRRPHHDSACTRLPVTTIVAGIQARHRVMSVVPAY